MTRIMAIWCLYFFLLAICGLNKPVRATLTGNDSHCSTGCWATLPLDLQIYWHPRSASSTLTAFTVVTIINSQRNVTRYTTKTGELPSGYILPQLDQHKTHVCVFGLEGSSEPAFSVTFPSSYQIWQSSYQREDCLQTTSGNITGSSCFSTRAMGTTSILPASQWASIRMLEKMIHRDPYGLNHECKFTWKSIEKRFLNSGERRTDLDFSFVSMGPAIPLETDPVLTTAGSTSYETDETEVTRSYEPLSTNSLSPASYSTLASRTSTESSSRISPPGYQSSIIRTESPVQPTLALVVAAPPSNATVGRVDSTTGIGGDSISDEPPCEAGSDKETSQKSPSGLNGLTTKVVGILASTSGSGLVSKVVSDDDSISAGSSRPSAPQSVTESSVVEANGPNKLSTTRVKTTAADGHDGSSTTALGTAQWSTGGAATVAGVTATGEAGSLSALCGRTPNLWVMFLLGKLILSC